MMTRGRGGRGESFQNSRCPISPSVMISPTCPQPNNPPFLLYEGAMRGSCMKPVNLNARTTIYDTFSTKVIERHSYRLLPPPFLVRDSPPNESSRLLKRVLTTSSSPAASATPATASSASSPASDRGTALCLFPGLVLGLWRVVDEECVERERVWEDEVSDGGAADVHGVERDRVLALDGHLDCAKGRVHLR